MNKRDDLTDEQLYNLEVLVEEAGEIIQAKSKIIRFGLHDYHPKNKMPNQQKLGMEIGNMLKMVDILVDQGIILTEDINRGNEEKEIKLKTWGFGKHKINSNL